MNPWTLFWRQGHSTTFGDYFQAGYDGAVAQWWQSTLDTLPSEPVVMEIGCGNCSLLPAMIKSNVKGRYVGVDLAKVSLSPVAQEGLAESEIDVSILAETPAERIPEPDSTVDLVASVFGVEYSDLHKSLPEAFRLLRQGGRFCALLHHHDSVVTTMSRKAISEYIPGDIQTTADALTVISQQRDKVASPAQLKTNAKAEKNRKRINALAEKYLNDTNFDTTNATMFEFMTNALNFFKMMSASQADRIQFISSLLAEHEASHERFKQMVSVAFDQEGIDSLQCKLAQSGFTETTIDVLHSDDNILAWKLCTKKS